MAIVSTISNRFKSAINKGEVDFESDVFKLILMNTTFSFDPDSDFLLADVTADQLASGNGYTQNNITLANGTLTEDLTNDRSRMTWDDVSVTASGGSIGPTGALIIYDDTHASDIILGCTDFGYDITITDGLTQPFNNIAYNLG